MSTSVKQAQTASMVGIWVFVLSDAVGFAALLTTMASLRLGSAGFAAQGTGPDLTMGLAATGILALVSVCMVLAGRRPAHARALVGAATIAALAFCGLQYFEYKSLLGPNIQLSTPALESFVVVTGYHLVHVFAGALALVWGLTKKSVPLGPLSVYWHFVDGLWLFIFVFFYLL
jgi:heme/copper-type cytochrome/quinol oxidase subunit 3